MTGAQVFLIGKGEYFRYINVKIKLVIGKNIFLACLRNHLIRRRRLSFERILNVHQRQNVTLYFPPTCPPSG